MILQFVQKGPRMKNPRLSTYTLVVVVVSVGIGGGGFFACGRYFGSSIPNCI